jgi:thiosulfate/3-mercaptopyruvate sulfurtransferase
MKPVISALLLISFLALPVSGFAALNDFFVSTSWVADQREKVVVIDVRNTASYLLGHVEGALSVPRSEFLQTRDQVKSLVPTASATSELLGSLGITSATTVIAYAEDDNPYAARFVWTLRYHGHKNSYVLDGGYDKWALEGRATRLRPSSRPQPSEYRLSAEAEYSPARAEADYIYTRLENPRVLIWDTRRASEYQGTEVRADRGGHLPGAVHLHWTELQTEVNGVKVLKSRAALESLLAAHGLSRDKEIVAHCQTGIRSSYATLVLLGLGYEQAKNYDGSWFEWANNPTLPIINADGELQSSAEVSLSLAGTARD